MTDAPMTPREIAEHVRHLLLYGAAMDGNVSESERDIEKLITDRDAAIRREAQTEAFAIASEHHEVWIDEDPTSDLITGRGACSCGKVKADGVTRWPGIWKKHIQSLGGDPNHRERIVAQAQEQWRKLLWLNHARYLPFVHMPYGDDGEMQCCGIDFKRWSAEDIERLLVQRFADPARLAADAEKEGK